MISVQDVTFTYKSTQFHFAIDQLKIEQGQSVAIIGPSGCGKTTLLSLLAGILPCQSGSIIIKDQLIHQLSEAERRAFRVLNIGSVFQDFSLIDYLTVLDNILHPFRINRYLKLTNEARQRAEAMSSELGIAHCLHDYIGDISQGELQRTAICRALICRPGVILADEPTGNLDPKNKQWVLNTLKNYAQKHQAALVVATHDMELLKHFDQVITLPGADHANGN